VRWGWGTATPAAPPRASHRVARTERAERVPDTGGAEGVADVVHEVLFHASALGGVEVHGLTELVDDAFWQCHGGVPRTEA
jgi:hypothetical protein